MIFFLADTLVDTFTPYQEIFSTTDLRNLKYLFYIILGVLTLFGLFYYLSEKIKSSKLQINQSSTPYKQDFEKEIKIIYDYHNAKGYYRDGCYKISATLKSFLETVYNKDVEEMTVLEIEKNLKDNYAHEIMKQLSNYQFRKKETSLDEFEKIYQKSLGLIKEKKKNAKKI